MVRMVAGVSAMQYSAKELGPFLQLFDDQAPRRIESSHPMRRIQCTCVVSEIAFLPRSRSSHIIVYKSTHLYVIICLERDLGERDLEPEGCRDRVPSTTEIHASVCTFCMFTMQ